MDHPSWLPSAGRFGVGIDRTRLSTSSLLAGLVLAASLVVVTSFLFSARTAGLPVPLTSTAVNASAQSTSVATIAATLQEAAASGETGATRDSRRPVWIYVKVPQGAPPADRVVEVRTLRLDGSRFWRVTKDSQGNDSFVEAEAGISEIRSASKAGYSIRLPKDDATLAIIGELRHYLNGSPPTYLWNAEEYLASELAFERQGGALFGSLLILSAFSAIVALLNRDITFLLFSGWLVTALRVAAVNAGWDKYWIGLQIPIDTYHTILRVSIAAYGFFTVALFRQLLLAPSTPNALRTYFWGLQYAFVLFMAAAPFSEHITFFQAYWVFAGFGLGTLTFYLLYALVRARTRVVGWYALSWGAMIAGMTSEIGAQSGAFVLPQWLSAQSASIVSALTMGLTLADRLRSERDGRLAAQAKSLTYLKKYEENYNSMPVGLFGLSDSGTVLIHNPAFAAMFASRNQSASITGHIDTLLGDGSFDRIKTATQEGVKELEVSLTSDDGNNHWFLVRVAAKESSIEGSIQDVTTRKEAEHKLKHLVDHDSLTGLLNRRGLDASLKRVAELVNGGTRCAIAYVDLDRFRLINDLHGHGTGDALLLQAGRRLNSAVRGGDLVARLADAFVVLFVDCPDCAVAELTERIRVAIGNEPFEIEGKGLNMTASVGVVSIEAAMSTIDAIAAADRACSEAKARGRNCVVRLTEQDSELRTHLEELRVIADLQRRIPADMYFLEFQPIVALRSAMSSLSYEMLIRKRGDDGKVVPPGRFIGAAERNGLMSQIDRWVLRSTLEWLDGHPEHRDRLSFATINISGASLNDTRFVDDAFAMIAEHPLAMPKLCFEITESVALHDLGSTRRFVDRVRIYGSKLALDDFGAGYTSFNYLKEIPADFIKIDGSFVKDINRNPANYAITRTIVELTHELGMRSIAEWAETPDTIASLYDLGVDYGQGFGLVRPIAPDIVTAASSGGALVRDPQVIALLNDRTRPAPLSRVRRAAQHDLS